MKKENKFENSILQFCIDALETLKINVEQGFVAINYRNSESINLTYLKPFNEEKLPLYIRNNITLKQKFLKAHKQHIYRDPKDIYYYKNLKENANTGNHFSIRVKDFKYDKDAFYWNNATTKLIEYLKKNSPSVLSVETIGADILYKFKWESLDIILDGKWRESDREELFYHNDFDFFFLNSATNNYTFIPVPILSAITIWYVLDGDHIAAEDYFNEIYTETRYAVLNHVIEALSYYITEKISNGSIKTKASFVSEYIKSLAGLVLPIAYKYCEIKTSNNNCLIDKLPRCLTDQCDDSCFIINRCRNDLQGCVNCRFINERNCKYAANCNPIINIYSEHLPCPFSYDFPTKEKFKSKEVIKLAADSNTNESYYVTFYLPAYKVINIEGEAEIIQAHPGYKASVQLFKSLIGSNFKLLYKQWKSILEVKKHASRAAISQAMLRNESHNHGSHVLVNLVDEDKLSQNAVDDLVLKKGNFNYNYSTDLMKEEKSQQGQIAIFNKYIKGRMDFLSEITFGVSNMITSINLAEVYRVLDKNLLLLNHIAGIDDFNFRIDFRPPKNTGLDQLLVAFPSDILGCQALYNIIEAVIRNTAKYGNTNGVGDSKTVFTLEFSEMPLSNDNENQFYKVEIFDNRNFIGQEKLDEIRDIIELPVIDEKTNELRNKGLGILEMQACAAFLRQIDVSEIDRDSYYPIEMDGIKNKYREFPILEPFLKNSNRLGYRFYLQKPKELLFVGDWKTDSEVQTFILNRFGINILPTDEFINALVEGKTFYHQFLLFDETIYDKSLKWLSQALQNGNNEQKSIPLIEIFKANTEIEGVPSLLTLLPVRMMDVTNSKDDLMNLIYPPDKEGLDFDELEEKIWILWKDQLFSRKKLNDRSVIRLISGPTNNQIDENEYTICLLDHNTNNSYQECKKNERIKAIEPLSSNARKKFPGWKDSYGAKINEYIDAIQKKDCQNLIFNEYKNVLIDKGLIIEQNQIATYDEINQMLNAKRAAGIIDAAVVAELKKIGASIKHKFENEETYSLTRNIIKIFEAYTNSVIVIDERIQNYAKGDYHGINNQEIYDSINCYIPSKELVNLADKEMLEKQKTIIFKFIDDKIKSSEFLVVHYGLLERLYNSEEKRSFAIKNKLSEWAKIIRVVVTSGRGKHSLDLPDDVCYVNLSPVTNVFIENRSKYAINYLLNQSRR